MGSSRQEGRHALSGAIQPPAPTGQPPPCHQQLAAAAACLRRVQPAAAAAPAPLQPQCPCLARRPPRPTRPPARGPLPTSLFPSLSRSLPCHWPPPPALLPARKALFTAPPCQPPVGHVRHLTAGSRPDPTALLTSPLAPASPRVIHSLSSSLSPLTPASLDHLLGPFLHARQMWHRAGGLSRRAVAGSGQRAEREQERQERRTGPVRLRQSESGECHGRTPHARGCIAGLAAAGRQGRRRLPAAWRRLIAASS